MGAHRGLRAFTPHYLCVASAEPGIGVNPQGTMVPCTARRLQMIINDTCYDLCHRGTARGRSGGRAQCARDPRSSC